MLHLAEEMAGRQLFRRWAKDSNGSTIMVEVGGCSEGFHKFNQIVSDIAKNVTVGKSSWRIFEVNPLIDVAQKAIKENQRITHCDDSDCGRCNDSAQGGPILL